MKKSLLCMLVCAIFASAVCGYAAVRDRQRFRELFGEESVIAPEHKDAGNEKTEMGEHLRDRLAITLTRAVSAEEAAAYVRSSLPVIQSAVLNTWEKTGEMCSDAAAFCEEKLTETIPEAFDSFRGRGDREHQFPQLQAALENGKKVRMFFADLLQKTGEIFSAK